MNPKRLSLYYKISLILFCTLFIGSAVLTVADTKGSYEVFAHLQFPDWILYPLSLSKLLGVIAIVWSKCKTLKDFAFAGFLYDLLLAFGAHFVNDDIEVWLAFFGLVLWLSTFWLYQKTTAKN